MTKKWFEEINIVVERGSEDETILEEPFIKIKINSTNQIHLTDKQALKLSKEIEELLK